MTIRISEELNLILNFSREEAMRTGSYGIGPDHMMLGIIRHGDNQACEILKELGLDLQEMKQFIDSKIFSDISPSQKSTASTSAEARITY